MTKPLSQINLRKGDMVILDLKPNPGALKYNLTTGGHHWFIDTDGCSRNFEVKKAGEIKVVTFDRP